MKPRIAVALVLMLLSGLVVFGQAATRTSPSTAEERKRALDLTQKLEHHPLGDNAEQDRAWLTNWIIEIPDLTVPICDEVLKPLLQGEMGQYRYSKELVAQNLAGSMAYIIRHPEAQQGEDDEDDYAINKAGLESALNAYEAIVKANAKGGKWAPLEEIIKRRKSGQLDAYVRQATLKCMTGETITAELRAPKSGNGLRLRPASCRAASAWGRGATHSTH